jgi:hypothetical protein
MPGEFLARSIAVGGICLLIGLAAGTMPAHAQAQPLTAFSPFDPQLAMANPFASAGFTGAPASGQQTYAAKWGSGTLGLSVESGSLSGNFLGSPFAFPSSGQQDWFTGPGDPAWRTSVVGGFRSNPDAALGGLYSTASFGITSIRANPSALPGLANLYPGNDATAVSASAGLGLQLTPQISIEGSVGFTQGPVSPFR